VGIESRFTWTDGSEEPFSDGVLSVKSDKQNVLYANLMDEVKSPN
jgi:hypothetical protein